MNIYKTLVDLLKEEGAIEIRKDLVGDRWKYSSHLFFLEFDHDFKELILTSELGTEVWNLERVGESRLKDIVEDILEKFGKKVCV